MELSSSKNYNDHDNNSICNHNDTNATNGSTTTSLTAASATMLIPIGYKIVAVFLVFGLPFITSFIVWYWNEQIDHEEDTQIDVDQTNTIINNNIVHNDHDDGIIDCDCDGHTLIDNDALMVVEEERIRNEETVKKR